MLFNSQIFILVFLPITLVLFYLSALRSHTLALSAALVASLIFYSYWNPKFVILLLLSIVVNYTIGRNLILYRDHTGPDRRAALLLGLGAFLNLAAISYFKYYNFFINNVNTVFGSNIVFEDIFLPLGISFFTFQQIAYLVDCYQGKTKETNFRDYALFVSFFPQLIAGPIVHHSQMMPQFKSDSVGRFNLPIFLDGVTIFILGLAKKVILADAFGKYADVGFSAAASGVDLTFFEGWAAALSYTFQLYFDFSGYSDMAIGLGLMFNIQLPFNFNSPYKAANIIDFWRRWHMTLSAFLRDYLYIPLGGNRKGETRRHANLMATMLLGGLWHGAAWTFVLWGGLHGIFLVINHLWAKLSVARMIAERRVGRAAGWLITFLAVVGAWVIFRATSFGAALQIYRGMLGINGATMPDQFVALLPGVLRGLFHAVGKVPYVGDATVLGFLEVFTMIAVGLFISVFMPNLYEVSRNTRTWFLIPAFAFTVQKVFFSFAASPFLYFQF
jgi:alginate O-acetyltransferase complex protein AlgI